MARDGLTNPQYVTGAPHSPASRRSTQDGTIREADTQHVLLPETYRYLTLSEKERPYGELSPVVVRMVVLPRFGAVVGELRHNALQREDM